ncbi:hypothetical protein R1flu_012866 [Riccia fluitans]|uniref:Uncharacterized protein n=1 Tax=Riccia fluitans TaxID=41844 RepID=A0ABD1ZD07_9MARC
MQRQINPSYKSNPRPTRQGAPSLIDWGLGFNAPVLSPAAQNTAFGTTKCLRQTSLRQIFVDKQIRTEKLNTGIRESVVCFACSTPLPTHFIVGRASGSDSFSLGHLVVVATSSQCLFSIPPKEAVQAQEEAMCGFLCMRMRRFIRTWCWRC